MIGIKEVALTLIDGQWTTNPLWKWDGSDPNGVGLTPPNGLVNRCAVLAGYGASISATKMANLAGRSIANMDLTGWHSFKFLSKVLCSRGVMLRYTCC